ncbi:MAG: hypothetical protein KA368_17825 [Acidobacteria bacterium]|nr:hypothetical protein [Acidobacteriota bacterium]
MKIKSIIIIFMLTICLAALSATAFAQRAGGRLGKAGTESSAAARTGNKPSGSHISETQQQNIQKLTTDLQAIKQGSQVTPEMKQALKNDLMAMADGATKPDPTLVDKLAADLADAMSDGKITNAEKAKLTNDLYAVMNSANIPASEVNQAVADAQVLLAASGVEKQDAQLIVNDLKAIAAEAQKNLPNSGGTQRSRAGRFGQRP